MPWITSIKEKIKNKNTKLILPEAYDARVLFASCELTKENLAQVFLIGDPDRINYIANENKVSLSGINIINPESYEEKDNFIQTFYEDRKHKGISWEDAVNTMKNPLYFGAMMLAQNKVDCFVGGCVNATSDVIKAVILVVKPAYGIRTVSSCTIHILNTPNIGENGIMLFSDPGVIPEPTADQLADIAIASARKWENIMKCQAKVAMLSFSTKGSASHPLVDKIVQAVNIVKEKNPEILIDGELQVDAAVVPEIGAFKCPGSPVAGRANVLIFPDLNSANIGYKLIQRLGNTLAYGPILQGLTKPCSDLSRGCSSQDIVDVSCIVIKEAIEL